MAYSVAVSNNSGSMPTSGRQKFLEGVERTQSENNWFMEQADQLIEGITEPIWWRKEYHSYMKGRLIMEAEQLK